MVDVDAGVRRVSQALRRHKPAMVRAHLGGDGAPSEYKVGSGAKRWAELVSSLPADMVRLEMLDAKGAIIHAMDFDAGPTVEDVAPAASSATKDVAALLKLVSDSADVQVKRHAELQGKLVEQVTELAGILATRLASLERMMGDVLGLAYTSTVQAAQAAGAAPTTEDRETDQLAKNVIAMAMNKMNAPAAGKK